MKKRWISGLLAAVFCLLAVGCRQTQNDDDKFQKQDVLQAFDRYDLELYMKPLWQGDLVYNETLMFVGKEDKAPLLYPAVDVISVRSYDLTKEYARGVDYEYDEASNSIILKENTAMPYLSLREYYPTVPREGATFPCTLPGKMYIAFREGSYFSSKQLAVTYRHTGRENLPAPQSQAEAFRGVIEKLQNNQAPKLLFYGDSITVGGNSSGFIDYGPHADIWAKMVFDSMVNRYGCTNAEYVNTAVGGWNSQNGLNALDESVIAYQPDAIFLAFGMNDTSLTPQLHIRNIRAMVSRIRASLPDAAICLVTTMLPNKEVEGFYGSQDSFDGEYLAYLEELKAAGDDRVCVANITEIHRQILENKRYYDMTGNNVNHVNDFMARVYAQTVFQTVCGE